MMSWPRRHGPLLALILVYLILGIAFSIETPLFEAPDEVWHVAYIRFVSQHGALPVQGAGRDDETARQEASQPPLYYLLATPIFRLIDTSDLEALSALNPHAAPGFPHSDGNKNMVTPHSTSFPWSGAALAVHVVRLFSLLLGVVTIIATFALGQMLFGNHNHNNKQNGSAPPPVSQLPLFLAALVALNPQFLFINASVNNDNLMVALSAVGLALVASLVAASSAGRLPRRRLILLGVISGLSAITKLTGLLLVAFIILGVVWATWRRRGLQPRASVGRAIASDVAVIGLLTALIAGWWYLRNLWLYGDITGLAGMLAWVGRRSLSPSQLVGELQGLELSFWAVFGWFNILVDDAIYAALQIMSRLALLGLIVLLIASLRRRNTLGLRLPVLAVAVAWAAMVLFGLVSWTASTPGTQGRLLFPAIGAICALLLIGWASLLPDRWHTPVFAILCGGLLLLSAVAPFRYITPAYAKPPVVSGEAATFEHLVDLRYGNQEIQVLGYQIAPQAIRPGDTISVTLFMQALKPMEKDHSLFIHLWGRDGEWLGQRDSYPGRGSMPTSQWPAGTIIEDRYLVTVAPTATVPARVQLEVGFYEYETGEKLQAVAPDGTAVDLTNIGRAKLMPQPQAVRPIQPARFTFGDRINLIDAQIETPPIVRAGSVLTVTTTWQAISPVPDDYTIFLQLVDQNPTVLAQKDVQPQGGEYPTGLWAPGEIVTDERTITLPANLPAGRYRLVTGVYLLAGVQRLPGRGPTGPSPDNWAVLDEITVR